MSGVRRPRPVVAIDGPAGAGKSTVARRLARALGFVLVDTGAMYRAVAFAAAHVGVSWDEAARLGELARGLVARRAIAFELDENYGVRVKLDGREVSEAIRAPEIAMGASTVSAHKPVRDALFDMQRQAGDAGGVVLEGRDIGTVVFPDAEVKFFLTARPDVRARRRFEEQLARPSDGRRRPTFEETLAEVRTRDDQDTSRTVAPLRQAVDAILIDSSDNSIDETVERMVAEVRGRSETR
ncbi:MAG: (d)CMP kinase [Myxococcota bacterium]|nr:(d)CMP kinase [Myxococcota bacterium]